MGGSTKAIAGIGGLVALLLLALVLKMALTPSHQITASAVHIDVRAGAAERLSTALTYPTVSGPSDAAVTEAAFTELLAYLQQTFPRFHGELDVRRVSRFTVHAVWKGTDPSLQPVVVLAHTDVVPIAPGTEDAWEHPPFSGRIADGYIWGRGSIDNKQNVLAYLEATEALLAAGHRPQRDVHFVFGHDEEVGGHAGAAVVARQLGEQGIRPLAVYDEGLIIADGLVPGMTVPVGLIGVAEKGYVTLRIQARGAEGHSSMPPADGTAVGVLATAITRLEGRPFDRELSGPAAMLLDTIGPEAKMPERLIFTNRWLFGPVITSIMGAKRSGDATLRTTIAPTMLEASVKENVLPDTAAALVNFRIHPRDSVDSVKEHVERAISDDRITVRIEGAAPAEPSVVSPTDGHGWTALQTSYAEVFPGMPVAPGLFVAQTDSRHFDPISDSVYRFQPVPSTAEDLGRIHGTNERIAVDAYQDIVRLYTRLLVNAGGP